MKSYVAPVAVKKEAGRERFLASMIENLGLPAKTKSLLGAVVQKRVGCEVSVLDSNELAKYKKKIMEFEKASKKHLKSAKTEKDKEAAEKEISETARNAFPTGVADFVIARLVIYDKEFPPESGVAETLPEMVEYLSKEGIGNLRKNECASFWITVTDKALDGSSAVTALVTGAYIAESNSLFIGYDAVHGKWRGKGEDLVALAKAIEFGDQCAKTMGKGKVSFVTAELDVPKNRNDDEAITRMKTFDKYGGKILPINYKQPGERGLSNVPLLFYVVDLNNRAGMPMAEAMGLLSSTYAYYYAGIYDDEKAAKKANDVIMPVFRDAINTFPGDIPLMPSGSDETIRWAIRTQNKH